MSEKKYRSASIRQLRPHLTIADDLGWTPLELRNFMWSHGKLRMMGAKREQLLAVLKKRGIAYPPDKPVAGPTPAPQGAPPTQKPPIPPMPRDPPAVPAATRPTRTFQPDVKRAVAELEQFQNQLLSRLTITQRPAAFEATALVFVIRALGHLRPDA
jgi:hypothetical protein